MLSGNGVATLLVFRSKASNLLKLVATEDDDIDGSLADVAHNIVKESNVVKRDKFKFRTRLSFQDVIEDTSPTLIRLLSLISVKFEMSLSAAMVANSINVSLQTSQHPSRRILVWLHERSQ